MRIAPLVEKLTAASDRAEKRTCGWIVQ